MKNSRFRQLELVTVAEKRPKKSLIYINKGPNFFKVSKFCCQKIWIVIWVSPAWTRTCRFFLPRRLFLRRLPWPPPQLPRWHPRRHRLVAAAKDPGLATKTQFFQIKISQPEHLVQANPSLGSSFSDIDVVSFGNAIYLFFDPGHHTK